MMAHDTGGRGGRGNCSTDVIYERRINKSLFPIGKALHFCKSRVFLHKEKTLQCSLVMCGMMCVSRDTTRAGAAGNISVHSNFGRHTLMMKILCTFHVQCVTTYKLRHYQDVS